MMYWPTASSSIYDYLVTGEMREIRENASPPASGVAGDLRLRRARPTDLEPHPSNGTATSYAYDGGSRLTSLAHNFGGNGNDLA